MYGDQMMLQKEVEQTKKSGQQNIVKSYKKIRDRYSRVVQANHKFVFDPSG